MLDPGDDGDNWTDLVGSGVLRYRCERRVIPPIGPKSASGEPVYTRPRSGPGAPSRPIYLTGFPIRRSWCLVRQVDRGGGDGARGPEPEEPWLPPA
jgi:hypothetical protein